MFKTFPQFTKLTMDDKDEYESYIRRFPPVSEISFTSLMTWWNLLGTAAVSKLNGNLVTSYWLPGDDRNSGLSIIGSSNIDESICTVLDFLKAKDEPARLVHMSEFVVNELRHPELFRFTGERDYDEYIFSISSMYPSVTTGFMQAKTKSFLRRVGVGKVTLEVPDLSHDTNRERLIFYSDKWLADRESRNKAPGVIHESLRAVLMDAHKLNMEAVCMYINGALRSFFLFQVTHDSNYATANYWMADMRWPGIFEYSLYLCAGQLHERGVKFLNLDFDLGDPYMRNHQLAFAPVNFFRKYRLEPQGKY